MRQRESRQRDRGQRGQRGQRRETERQREREGEREREICTIAAVIAIALKVIFSCEIPKRRFIRTVV
ncbi:hypothetical protein DPMN_170551 [Dreissena polymorpha]|uniref:Uncharacterized protein n=1 Tax=Dreissena polymorpha TaxID=45954 RepID=A0A9D4DYM9_DREPO|nr:hypothetical protein DPMN_170551 [Dreissena polymorpha]